MINYILAILLIGQLASPIQGVVLGVKNSVEDVPRRKATTSFEPIIKSKSALVLDSQTGRILMQKNAFQKRPIASITKLMTALVFLDRQMDLDNAVTISLDDRQNGGVLVLNPGDQVKLRDLLQISLISSVNSAADVLARSTDLSYEEFIEAMNSKAKELGMEDSVFVDPVGISAGNQATAMGVAKLLKAARRKSLIEQALSSSSYNFYTADGRYHLVKNTNQLLGSYLDVVGGKTGYIDEAGYCLVSLISHSQAKGDIIVVVLGADSEQSRFQENKFLAQWAFDNWEWEQN